MPNRPLAFTCPALAVRTPASGPAPGPAAPAPDPPSFGEPLMDYLCSRPRPHQIHPQLMQGGRERELEGGERELEGGGESGRDDCVFPAGEGKRGNVSVCVCVFICVCVCCQ